MRRIDVAKSLTFTIAPDENVLSIHPRAEAKTAAVAQLPSLWLLNQLSKDIAMTEFVESRLGANGVLKSRGSMTVSPGRRDRSLRETGTSAGLATMYTGAGLRRGETFAPESISALQFLIRGESCR